MKNQIITCSQNLLTPPVKATPRTIAINHYLLCRSLEIKCSYESAEKNKRVSPLRKIITLQDMCEKCAIPFDNKLARQDARTTTAILHFFVENRIIKILLYLSRKIFSQESAWRIIESKVDGAT